MEKLEIGNDPANTEKGIKKRNKQNHPFKKHNHSADPPRAVVRVGVFSDCPYLYAKRLREVIRTAGCIYFVLMLLKPPGLSFYASEASRVEFLCF